MALKRFDESFWGEYILRKTSVVKKKGLFLFWCLGIVFGGLRGLSGSSRLGIIAYSCRILSWEIEEL